MRKWPILITRPEPAARSLAFDLEQQGYKTWVFPTLEISAAPDQSALRQYIESLAQQNWAVFTSQHAVYYALSLLADYYPRWPKKVKVAAIGSTTNEVLTANNIPVEVVPLSFTSEALLACAEWQDIQDQKFLLFSGLGGRTLLETTLTTRGAKVHKVITYQRHCPQVDSTPLKQALLTKQLTAIISTSVESLENLLKLLGDKFQEYLRDIPLIVISERMQQTAIDLGITAPLYVAENATHTALLTKIKEVFT